MAQKRPTVQNVADFFLSRVDVQSGSSMTHLKLQKLCYYAQAWNLVFNGKKLFNGSFQAWVHGPVCPSLWKKYKHYHWHEVPLVENFDDSVFTKDEIEVLEAVEQTYGLYDGKYLEELTHQELPWKNAREGVPDGTHCTNVISIEDMNTYYSELLAQYE